MIELGVQTEEGLADGRLFVPAGDGPFPLVVYYTDAGGLRAATTDMAVRLVGEGYAVLQPNLYWRSGPYAPFDAKTAFADPGERQRIMALIQTVKNANVAADTLRLVGAIPDPRVRSDRFGCVGYSMGGRAAFVVACALGERVAAVAAIHAGGLVTDATDSPHHGIPGIRGEVYLGIADRDNSCTAVHQEVLREALDGAGIHYRMEVFPNALHGFAVPDFPVYDADAAERHWQRVLALFQSNLGA